MNKIKYYMNQYTKIESETYLTDDERYAIYIEFKEIFKNRTELGIDDILFYNFIRNKTLFSGLKSITLENINLLKSRGENYSTPFLYSPSNSYYDVSKRMQYYSDLFSKYPKLEKIFILFHSSIIENYDIEINNLKNLENDYE